MRAVYTTGSHTSLQPRLGVWPHRTHARALWPQATQHTLLTETYSCHALLFPSARYIEERFALCAGTWAGSHARKRGRTRLC